MANKYIVGEPMFELDDPLPKPISTKKEGFTARQLKAINWYCEQCGYRLQLCNPPMQMHFTRKSDGSPVTATLDEIIDGYKKWNDEDKRIRARERARLKKGNR